MNFHRILLFSLALLYSAAAYAQPTGKTFSSLSTMTSVDGSTWFCILDGTAKVWKKFQGSTLRSYVNTTVTSIANGSALAGISAPYEGDLAINTAKDTLWVRDDAAWIVFKAGSSGSTPNLQNVLTTGNSANSTRITNLGTPIGSTDAATKGYIDTQLSTAVDAANVYSANVSNLTRDTAIARSNRSLRDSLARSAWITQADMGNNSVGSNQIITGAVSADEIAASGVTAGAYKNSNITVDQDGRVIEASSGSSEIYVNGISGNDANTGSSKNLAKKTISSLTLSQIINNKTFLAKGSFLPFVTSTGGYTSSQRIEIEGYDVGDRQPSILGYETFNKSSFTVNGTYSNVYQTTFTFTATNAAGYNYILIEEAREDWWNGKLYTRVNTLAAAAATKGTYYYVDPGSTPVSLTIYVNPFNSITDFNITTKNNSIFSTPAALELNGVTVRGSVQGYGVIGAGSNSNIQNSILGLSGTHHAVVSSGTINNCLFAPSQPVGTTVAAIALTFYKDNPKGETATVSNSYFYNNINPIYCHNSLGDTAAYKEIKILNNYFYNPTGKAIEANNVNMMTSSSNYFEYVDKYYVSVSKVNYFRNNIIYDLYGYNLITFIESSKKDYYFNNNVIVTMLNDITTGVSGQNAQSVLRVNGTTGSNSKVDFRNNIVHVRNKNYGGEIFNTPSIDSLLIYNNIFIIETPGQICQVVTDFGSGKYKGNNNIFIVADGTAQFVLNSAPGTPDTNVSGWYITSGQEQNSVFLNLKELGLSLNDIFNDPLNGDYTFNPTSPYYSQLIALHPGRKVTFRKVPELKDLVEAVTSRTPYAFQPKPTVTTNYFVEGAREVAVTLKALTESTNSPGMAVTTTSVGKKYVNNSAGYSPTIVFYPAVSINGSQTRYVEIRYRVSPSSSTLAAQTAWIAPGTDGTNALSNSRKYFTTPTDTIWRTLGYDMWSLEVSSSGTWQSLSAINVIGFRYNALPAGFAVEIDYVKVAYPDRVISTPRTIELKQTKLFPQPLTTAPIKNRLEYTGTKQYFSDSSGIRRLVLDIPASISFNAAGGSKANVVYNGNGTVNTPSLTYYQNGVFTGNTDSNGDLQVTFASALPDASYTFFPQIEGTTLRKCTVHTKTAGGAYVRIFDNAGTVLGAGVSVTISYEARDY